VPGRRSARTPVAFGHWSTLGEVQRPGVLPLDMGCVWGGCLTAARVGDAPGDIERISVRCEQAQRPG
jgi:bis(5'-nucleosyl)-tetraphosphatase (symmetrical)